MRYPSLGWKAVVLSLGISALTPAPGSAWVQDRNENKIDDRIEKVQNEGYEAAFENRDRSGRMIIATFGGDGAEPLRYGIYVGYDHRPTATDEERLRAIGIAVVKTYRYIDYIRSEATIGQIAQIAATAGVTRVEAIPMIYPANHYGSRVVRARAAVGLKKSENTALFPSARADLGLDGTGIVVAILDTGVNDGPDAANPNYPGHESVAGKFLGGGNFYFGQPIFNTPPDSSLNPDDHGAEASSYHATHVAGTSIGTGGFGNFFTGVAPAARLVDCKVLSDGGAGFGSADGVEWCIANKDRLWAGLAGADTSYRGIDVLNLSLGGVGGSDGTDANSQMMNAAVEAGLAVCIATGNDDAQNQISSPASADLCIAVGATSHNKTLSRADDLVTDFSNEGPRADDGDSDHYDEMKPSIVAPGANIISADGDPIAGDGTGYKPLSGTSMAAPHAAGVCALLRQANPDLTPLEIRSILQNTAEHNILSVKGDRPNDPFGLDPNYDPGCGWGLIDAYAAAKEALNSTSGVQVVQFRPVARPLDLEVDVTWVTQREHAFQGFNVYRAPDVNGAPGAFQQINALLVPPSPNGDPIIEGDDNRTPYVYVDADPALVLGATYWYRVAWVGADLSTNLEPAAPVQFGEPPRVATVSYSVAHNEPDTDLDITIGVSRQYEPLQAEFAMAGPSIEAEQDSFILLGPPNAGTATIGNEEHFWSLGLSQSDGVLGYLPPGNLGVANPWFLRVLEGHFVNRSGRITSFSIFVNDSAGSPSGTTYVTSSPLPAQTVEGMATTVWIPDRAVSVPTAHLLARGEDGAVRLILTLSEVSVGATARVTRGASSDFAARAPLTEAPLPIAGTAFEYVDRDVEPGVAYWYWVESTDRWGQTVVNGPVTAMSLGGRTTARLAGPNPIRDAGVFEYAVGADAAANGRVAVTLAIHDIQGRLVRDLKSGMEGVGRYRVGWDGRDRSGAPVAQGVYFLRFQAGPVMRTAKLSVVR